MGALDLGHVQIEAPSRDLSGGGCAAELVPHRTQPAHEGGASYSGALDGQPIPRHQLRNRLDLGAELSIDSKVEIILKHVSRHCFTSVVARIDDATSDERSKRSAKMPRMQSTQPAQRQPVRLR
ncbi:hypothetical protein [Sorangium sp. So ce362]|uniref:hypothetical protein n=1 Tax=Sorangium sp. So ce362 TaxID=3133303 RepID=UPI003F626853